MFIDASAVIAILTAEPARLNFGDCFAYACARANDLPLLYKGDDFTRTDIQKA